MRNIKPFFLGCVFLLCVLAAFPFQNQKQEETQSPPEQKSLVRLDLLVFPEQKPERSQRNIFTVRISGGRESGMDNVLSNSENIERTETGQPGDQARLSVYLKYMGYVKSGPKITALIVFEGEALAVEKGDMIALELQVVEITTEEIEVMGPDRQALKFPLEGDLL
jgi:hypothetical protein